MWDPYSEFSSFQLPNGLTIFHRKIDRPWIICHAIVHAGANQDPIGKEGVAHYFEHVLGDNIPGISREDLTAEIEAHGGLIEWGMTGFMFTSYTFKAPLTLTPRAFDAFGSMLFEATIERAIERERNVVIQEFNRYFPIVGKYDALQELFRKFYLLEGRRGRSLSPLGTPHSIAQITADDLQSFYDTYYTPRNTSLVTTGDLTVSELEQLLLQSPLSGIKVGERIAPKTPQEPYIIEASGGRVTRIPLSTFQSEKTDNGHFTALALLPGSTPHSHTVTLLMILEEILHETIRKERQWSYGANVSQHYSQDFREIEISIPLAAQGFDMIENVIDEAIDAILTDQNRFEKVKKKTLASIHMLDLNNGHIAHNALVDVRVQHRIETMHEMFTSWENVEFTDIVNLASYLSRDRRCMLMLHP